MSAVAPEQSPDLVAVACVVEASLLVASEWSRVLIEYVYPLLKRLNELHPSHQFRLAFVTYGAADTRPMPLLSKRFFAPLSLVTRELREEPSRLGIGQTNSGGGRGLSALEGLVAAIELFDILMASVNSAANHSQTQSPQKESRSLISHILHIAASSPDNVQRPHWNTLQHLDSVSWDSVPAELRKRQINLSLISLRKIPQFQDLHSSVAGPGIQSPWFNVHAPHVLLLAGFPAPQKSTKRQSETPLSDQSPDTKRQKVVIDPASKTSSASPAPPPARTPQRSQQQGTPQVAQLPTIGQNPSSAQPVQAAVSAPASTSVSTSPSVPLPTPGQSLPAMNPEQGVPPGVKFAERLKMLDMEILAMDTQISSLQNTGQTEVLDRLQETRASKARLREQIKSVLWQLYRKMISAKEAPNVQSGTAGSALPDGSVEGGPPSQPHPPNASGALSERPVGPVIEEYKPVTSDSQILTQFWQSRGGTMSPLNGSNPGTGQTQPTAALTPEVPARIQQPMEKKGNQPQGFGSASQISAHTSHETGVQLHATNGQPIQVSNTWNGTFTWTLPKFNGQTAAEMKIHISGIVAGSNPRTDIWPKNLTLNLCKEPVKDDEELLSWLKRHQPRACRVQFKPNPHAPDGPVNGGKFLSLYKFMADTRIYAYAGWRLPSGKFSYNIFIFPYSSSFAGALFLEGLPDLPGSGNALGAPPLLEEAKPQLANGPNIPPAILARLQSLDPAQQKQYLIQIRERIQRQHLLQAQQARGTSGQVLGSLGMSASTNPYVPGTVAHVPGGLQANISGPMTSGMHGTGGGTVNYEMLQSFMQRSAEGSASQGGKSG